MKSITLCQVLLFALGASFAPGAEPTPAPAPVPAAPAATFTEQQVLETVGWIFGRRMGVSELGFTTEQVESILKGFRASATSGEAPHDLDAIGPQLEAFMRTKENDYLAKMRAQTEAQSAALLAEAAKQAGAQVLPSGVVVLVEKPGEGEFPKPTDTVRVHYTGRLPDGTVFDSSVERGEPVEFGVSEVIDGWSEGIQKINKGGKLKLHIPAGQAYGDNPPPNSPIPPGAALAFEVELIEIIPPAPAPAPTPAPAPAAEQPAAPAK